MAENIEEILLEIDESQMQEYQKFFDMFDVEKKGHIMATQVGKIMQAMDQDFDDKQLRKTIRKFDADEVFMRKRDTPGSPVMTPDDCNTWRYIIQPFLINMKIPSSRGSGKLEFEEFAAMVYTIANTVDKETMEKELREAFRLFDKEKMGYILTSTLREILAACDDKLTDADLDAAIQEIDTDGSGTVDFDEFMEMMTGENEEE